MAIRLAVLVVALAAALAAQSQAWTLEEADAAQLERRLVSNPDDLAARARLMEYYRRADRYSHREDRAKRARHLLWLIEHRPECDLLHSPFARFPEGDLSAEDFRRAAGLWDAAAKAHPRDAAVLWNAAAFFEGLDPARHLRYLEATAAADPNHPYALRPLAHLYALTILDNGPLAARAQAGLEASKNEWVLGNAAYMLQSQYNLSLERGAPDARAAALAERYFLRAKTIDPKLNRAAILPHVDQSDRGRQRQKEAEEGKLMAARFNEAAGRIRRLPVEAFKELPPAVARVLRARGCTVPQPEATVSGAARHNVIRGEFFAKGEAGWAALCSVNGSSAILAFRNDRDVHPATVAAAVEDRSFLQGLGGDSVGFSREIAAVGRDFITRHYRAYGGPAPPPIDHQAIDDAFLGKASITRYFHRGQWLCLQGAD